MKFILLLLLSPLFAQAHTVDVIADPLVKITSYYSSSSLQPRLGSGMVILWQGHKYILTSDHVVYHSNRSFTQEIVDSAGHKETLDYLVSDAGRGLALLRFRSDDASFVPFDLTPKVDEETPRVQESITLMGFPADSDAVLIDRKGKLNNLNFPSKLFVELLDLMEIKGALGEFGMSGGAAFSANGHYRGLITHQIVTGGLDAVLLISASDVRHWLQNVLAVDGSLRSPSPIDLFQDPAQQVSDFPSYRSGNLYLAFSEPYGPGKGTALNPILSKTRATDSFYGGDNGPLAKLIFKTDSSVKCMGFRTNEVLGSFSGNASTLNLWLRQVVNPKIEPLWTYDDADTVANVRKARAYQRDFIVLAGKFRGIKASRLEAYVDRIVDLLEFTPNSDPLVQDPDEQSFGNWRMIKPKDLDYLLNDPSLQAEWSELKAVSIEPLLRQKLIELKAVITELTF